MILVVGCGKNTVQQAASKADKPKAVEFVETPTFTVDGSEYPSWSILATAVKAGLIDGAKGKQGPIEKEWNVDIVLHFKDYDPCLAEFGNSAVDAVCITNIDSLNLARGRASTAICPTSTSDGADKIIAVGYTRLKDLAEVKIHGLAKSVSQYSAYREFEKSGLDPKTIKWVNLDPAAAATALQTGTGDIAAICVWNPYALQTMNIKKGSIDVSNSKLIPEEIIDMILVGNDALKREGGDRFAACLCDTYYQINSKLFNSDQTVADATLMALSEDFFQLPLNDMKIVVTETRFFNTPDKGQELFGNEAFKKNMEVVVDTCKKLEFFDGAEPPSIGYNDDSKQLNFSTKYIEMVKAKK